MPLFYLHVCNGNGFVEDEEGTEFPDLAAARLAAIDGLRDILAAEVRAGVLRRASFIEIEDEAHRLVLTVPFSEAVSEPGETEKPQAIARPSKRNA
jgi:hypothetical protein